MHNSGVGLSGDAEWSIKFLEKQSMKKTKEGNSSKTNIAAFQFCPINVRMGGA